jgi:thiol:disulfide interchange protein
MEAGLHLAMRIVPSGFILLGLALALVAAIIKVSERKGLFRLAASIAVALGFVIGGAAQMTSERPIWPGCFGLAASCFLAWMGVRKFNRDPEGRTPPASML